MQDEESLKIRDALAGDQKAYEFLVDKHRAALFHIINRIVRHEEVANDLVQETFMKAFSSLATYRSEYRFSTWLYKIAANSSIDFLRKRRIKALSLDRPLETKDGEVEIEIADFSHHPERDLVRKEQRFSIEEAIDSLPLEGGVVELADGTHEVNDAVYPATTFYQAWLPAAEIRA